MTEGRPSDAMIATVVALDGGVSKVSLTRQLEGRVRSRPMAELSALAFGEQTGGGSVSSKTRFAKWRGNMVFFQPDTNEGTTSGYSLPRTRL